MMMAGVQSQAMAVTPVEVGELKVRVDVTGEFELAH